jgi:site-specific recombinase
MHRGFRSRMRAKWRWHYGNVIATIGFGLACGIFVAAHYIGPHLPERFQKKER